MKAKRVLILTAVVLLPLAGCPKRVKIEPEEVARRKLLVLSNREPGAYVWTMAGSMGAAVAFGMVGTAVSMALIESRGEKFRAALEDFRVPEQVLAHTAQAVRGLDQREVVPVCTARQKPESDQCAAVADLPSLQASYPGQLALVVQPCEYGLRNQKPYLAVRAGLFDIDTQQAVWKYSFVLKNQEIPEETRPWEDWLNQRELLKSSLDRQLDQLAKRIADFVATGQVPEEDQSKTAYVYMGCAAPSLKKFWE